MYVLSLTIKRLLKSEYIKKKDLVIPHLATTPSSPIIQIYRKVTMDCLLPFFFSFFFGPVSTDSDESVVPNISHGRPISVTLYGTPRWYPRSRDMQTLHPPNPLRHRIHGALRNRIPHPRFPIPSTNETIVDLRPYISPHTMEIFLVHVYPSSWISNLSRDNDDRASALEVVHRKVDNLRCYGKFAFERVPLEEIGSLS